MVIVYINKLLSFMLHDELGLCWEKVMSSRKCRKEACSLTILLNRGVA